MTGPHLEKNLKLNFSDTRPTNSMGERKARVAELGRGGKDGQEIFHQRLKRQSSSARTNSESWRKLAAGLEDNFKTS